MVKYALTFAAADVEYDITEANSNTFIAALLHACGVAPDRMLPSGIEASEAIGFSDWRDMVAEVRPPASGIFWGTGRLDRMAGRQFDEEFRLLGGDDVLRAGRGDSISASGGDGSDRIDGQDGNNQIRGEGGLDRLWGGAGNGADLGRPGPRPSWSAALATTGFSAARGPTPSIFTMAAAPTGSRTSCRGWM